MNEQIQDQRFIDKMSTRITVGIGGILLAGFVGLGLLNEASEHHIASNIASNQRLDAATSDEAVIARNKEDSEQNKALGFFGGALVISGALLVGTYRLSYGRIERTPLTPIELGYTWREILLGPKSGQKAD